MICSRCGEDAAAYYSVKCANYCTVCYSPELEREPTPNDHIISYLKYYCNLSSPEYALMLDGAWGAGKTWLLKEFFRYPEVKHIKHVYISVYGMSAFSEIEVAIFQALHPILSSKALSLAGKLLAGGVKATTKIDLSDAGFKETSLTSSLPEIYLPKYLQDTADYILVLDDIERCGIDTNMLFGYINFFVEHKGQKVILLCNESEISKDDKYNRIKEKLVGKTFVVQPDLVSATNHFLSLVDDFEKREIIKENISSIHAVYNLGGYDNLRNLKQGFFDLTRFLTLFPQESLHNKDFVNEIVKVFMAILIEIKAGSISASDIKRINSSWLKKVIGAQDGKSLPAEKVDVLGKYHFWGSNMTLADEIWQEFFGKGTVDKDSLLQSIYSTSFFKKDSWPDWMKLWHHRELEDNEFIELRSKVELELRSKSILEVGVVIHLVGMFLWFYEAGICQDSNREVIIKWGQEQIIFLKDSGLLKSVKIDSFGHRGWRGLGFYSNDDKMLLDFIQWVKMIKAEQKQEDMVEDAVVLLEVMEHDAAKFYRMIGVTNADDGLYIEMPILKYVDVDGFIESYLKLPPKQKTVIADAISNRYDFQQLVHKLVEERDWLYSVRKKLSELPVAVDKPLTQLMLRELIERLTKAIGVLDNVKAPEVN